jgi:hypothetical protein
LNPPHSLFCEKCGTRLIASLAEEPEESEAPAPASLGPKGLSLPTKSPTELEQTAAPTASEPPAAIERAQSSAEELPDWLQVVQSSATGAADTDIATGAADHAAPDEVPAWLSEISPADQSAQPRKPQTDELLPEWARRLRTTPEVAQPSAAEEEEVPAWLKTLGATGHLPAEEETPAAPSEETPPWAANLGATAEPAAAEEEELPEWLQEPPSPYFSAAPSETPQPPAIQAQPDAEDMPDWLRDLRPSGGEEALPDWLDELGKDEEPPAAEITALSTGDSALDWLSRLGATAPEPLPDESMASAAETPAWLLGTGEETQPAELAASTDWLSALRQATPEMEAEEEQSEWQRGTLEPGKAIEAQPESAQPEEEGIPGWLKGLGGAAVGAAVLGAHEEEQPAEIAPQKPVTDWLSALRQATPEMEAEEAQADEEIPEWLREETGAAPQAIGGPQAYDEEIPDWLRESGAAAQPAVSVEEEVPVWLHETPAPSEASETQLESTQPEEEGIPDWLKGAGLVAAGAALANAHEEEQPAEVAPQKPVTDWLSALRQATPEMEAEQAQTEEEIPEWLREEAGAAPQAIGGPQAYDEEVPDWLRETGAMAQQPTTSAEEEVPEWLRETPAPVEAIEAQLESTQPEEEGIPDWLKGAGVIAAGAALAGAREEEQPAEVAPQKPATDWLSTLRQATPELEAEQAQAEEEIPEWLREEAGVAPQAIGGVQSYDQEIPDWLRETTPASTAEESAPDETPDWLRELAPVAAVAGAAAIAAEPEALAEAAQPETLAEAEVEEESQTGKAAAVAAAGLAAATVAGAAKKRDQAEGPPAEMPEWLKEISREQEAAKTAIPVPPPEATGLTQAEIPSWVEAMRPSAEVAALKGAETPSETEGPLAGIANALPPAPVMDQMFGPPAKLSFAISAEDQARAGVLRELLTQHAAAPASVEQFVVKSSAIRRRALRWFVAFLIIAALLVPIGIDINQLTGLPLLPSAQKMVVPPAVSAAAFEISRLAQLPPNSKVLVVFDYDASQSGEMNRVATALLKSPGLRNAQLEIASLNPQGSAMAQAVLKNLPDLRYTALGFTPGQINGVQSLLASSGSTKLIIELAASPETVRWWAEQLKANRDETPLVAGVSAGAEPLTMPYVQSGQVKGLVSGFPGAVAYLNATGMMNTYSQDQVKDYQIPLDAITLANYVMVALIVVGLIAALLRGAGRRAA